MSTNQKFYITTPIYYVNDKPHIGHTYTTIAADVLARYYRLRLQEKNVFFLTGTDEHGSKIANAAAKNNKEPKQFVDEVSNMYKELWQSLDIKYDYFIRTTDKDHESAVKHFLEILQHAKTTLGNDALYEGVYEGLYCAGCEGFKKKSDLVDGLCPDHKVKPESLKEKNWFFRLSDYAELLQDLIQRDILAISPETRKNEVLGFLDQGLEDIAISRPNVKWGIPVPFDSEQTVYVWIDALVNYLTAIGYNSDENNFQKWWPADLHLIGKDILKFHAIIWPALLLAAGIAIPKKIFAHGYFTVDGQKMSKTIGNVVNPREVAETYSVDALRYFLLAEIPFGEDGDFSYTRFDERYHSDLVNGLGNLVSRVLTLAGKKYNNRVPTHSGNNFDKSIQLNKETWEKYHTMMEELRFHKVLENIWNWIRCCDEYIDKEKPWEHDKPDALYDLLESIRHIAWMLQPFIPETSKKILEQLFTDENQRRQEFNKSFEQITVWGGLTPETLFEKKGILFPRISN